ncbi:MAG: hypothetical protein J6S14_10590 [Clostridia bacterium]|nr:hypothetical protein [Clostridia bacterium]
MPSDGHCVFAVGGDPAAGGDAAVEEKQNVRIERKSFKAEFCGDDARFGGLKVSVAIEKHRKDAYRETIREGNPEGFVKIINVRARRELFRRTRRRVPDMDNDFEHTAKTCLYGELSTVLGICREDIHRIVTEGVSEL